MRSPIIAALGLAVVATATATGATAASARTGPAADAWQEDAVAAAQQLQGSVHKLHLEGQYGGVALDQVAHVLIVRVVGTGQQLLPLVSRLTVKTAVAKSVYSAAHLVAAAHTLVANDAALPRRRVLSAAPDAGGDGVDVTVARSEDLSSTYTADVPLHLRVGGRPVSAARYNDLPLLTGYSGGAYITDGAHACTSGFGVHAGATQYLLTAGHCGPVGGTWSTFTGASIGQVVRRFPPYDAMLISTNSSNSIYIGGGGLSGSATENRQTIVDWRSPVVGQYLCSGGAPSGTLCHIRVTAIGVSYFLGDDIGIVGSGVEIVQDDGTALYGNGDSGGPMYSATTTTQGYAYGLISAGYSDAVVPCTQGDPSSSTRSCWSRGLFTNIQDVLNVSGTTTN